MSATRRIFVIDDDPTICELLSEILSFQYHVSTECDPFAALESIECEHLDLLIIDLNMPRLNGEEAIPKIRERSSCRTLPILVLSAYSDAPQRVQGLDVQAVMGKPFDLVILVKTVERLLPPRNDSEKAMP